MKKYFLSYKINLLIAVVAASVLIFSCKKDSDGSNFSKAGNPVFGKISLDSGANGVVVSITGSDLGDIRNIIFSKGNVPASITPTLNTSSSIVFHVPDTAKGGSQNIVLTNSLDKSITVPFKVLAYAKVTAVSPSTDFGNGYVITLEGVNLDDVTDVKLTGTNDHATIVSKSSKQLVIKMPSSSVTSGTLDITNATGTSTTTDVFVNVDAAVAKVFTEDWDNGFVNNWGWGFVTNGLVPTTAVAAAGTSSLQAGWDPSGSWGGIQQNSSTGVSLAGAKFLVFWVKAATSNIDVQVSLDWGAWYSFTAKASNWTYIKIPMSTWNNPAKLNTFVAQIKGTGQTIYFDDIMFIK
jgi:hypothetical protein